MTPARPATVIVIGAGLAGLSAANELADAGFGIEILEAGTRPGGRVMTLHQPFADGMYAEAGAMSFTDTQPNLLHYVQQFDLPMDVLPQPPGSSICTVHSHRVVLNGTEEQLGLKLTPEEAKLGVTGIQNKYLGEGMKAIGDPTAPGWPSPDLAKLDQLSAAQYFRQLGASEGAIQLLSLSLLDFYGDGLETCSALFLLTTGSLVQNFNQLYAVRGGNELLPRAIASKLHQHLHYGCKVTRIEQAAAGVTAYFTRAGSEHSISGDYLVCAIPFTLARALQFTPPLSEDKRELIDQLPNTSVTRIFLQTRTRFWEQHGLSGSAQTDLPVMLIFSAYPRPGQRGILECYTSGQDARTLAGMQDSERDAYTLRGLLQVFPGSAEFVEGFTCRVWDTDPNALGAYAFYRPGQFVRFYPRLATPEGRIFFAGDQTTLLPGWMEGALQSGIRAAGQIRKVKAALAAVSTR